MGEHKLPRQPKEPGDHDVKKWMLGRFTVEMFPEGYVALNRELATGYHPKLEENLGNYPIDEIDIRLATIATYCGVAMDGAYTLESRSELCAILAGRLELLRDLTKGNSPQIIRSLDRIDGNSPQDAANSKKMNW